MRLLRTAVALLIVPLLAPAPALAAPPAKATVKDGPGITLVTGDRVTLSRTGEVAVTPGLGRSAMTFATTTVNGHVRVVPSDAGRLLAAGTLDTRLFDVTQLLNDAYDQRGDLPLIVTGAAPADIPGWVGRRALPAAKATAVRQRHGQAGAAWKALTTQDGKRLRSGIGKIWLDGVRHPALDVSVPQIGAPESWAAGYTGTGTTVAVLDTGVDAQHPDLAGQVAAHMNFTEGEEPDGDFAGHGTHVASTVVGTGVASGGKYKGVAPGAKVLDGKVCVQYGCLESWILAGMAWAAPQSKIVNLSLGGMDSEGLDPVEQAVETLSEQYGTLFVVAAGNADGPTEGAISSPGTALSALTVGAVDASDALARFSRRGPGPDGTLKPEITAPGVAITAARSAQSSLPGDAYAGLQGTSMATPHVAGAAALVLQQHPEWTGQRLKAALMAAAEPNPAFGVYAQGAGRVDVGRATRQPVTSTTPGISFGFRSWPHTDDAVSTQTVTYRNDEVQPVTLALELPGVPAELFQLGVASVTVPAGGEVSVPITVDTRQGPDGRLGGWLTATAPGVVVRTPIAVDKEVESYDVTLVHLDREGGTPSFFETQLARRDSDTYQPGVYGPDPSGTATVRVPAGHYTLTSFLSHSGDGGPKGLTSGGYATLLAQPDVLVDRNLTLTLDSRLGRSLRVTVPRPDAQQVYAVVGAYTRRPNGTAGTALVSGSFDTVYAAQLDPAQRDDRFLSIVSGQWAGPGPDGTLWNSPYFYAVSFPQPGWLVTGFTQAVADVDLAKVRADFARVRPETVGYKRVRSGLASWRVGNFGPDLGFDLPFSRTEYYTGDPDVGFSGDFTEFAPATEEVTSSVRTADRVFYRAGRAYHERWNRPVFGPSVNGLYGPGVLRTGEAITVDLPGYADGDGRPGWSPTTASALTLSRDGVAIPMAPGDFGWTFDVPPDQGTYRLESTAETAGPLSTRTSATWTFRSAHVDGQPVAVPLWAVRFTPDTDRFGAVPADTTHRLGVYAQPQTGSAAGQLTSLRLEVSFDDGRTWRGISVTDAGATVRTPPGSGFVSVRAAATDSLGGSVRETVIRAYRFG